MCVLFYCHSMCYPFTNMDKMFIAVLNWHINGWHGIPDKSNLYSGGILSRQYTKANSSRIEAKQKPSLFFPRIVLSAEGNYKKKIKNKIALFPRKLPGSKEFYYINKFNTIFVHIFLALNLYTECYFCPYTLLPGKHSFRLAISCKWNQHLAVFVLIYCYAVKTSHRYMI